MASKSQNSRRETGASLPLAIGLAVVLLVIGIGVFFLIRFMSGSKEAQNALDAGVLAVAKQSLIEPAVDLSSEVPQQAYQHFKMVARDEKFISLGNINRVWTQSLLVALNARRMIDQGKAKDPKALEDQVRSIYNEAKSISEKLTAKLKSDDGGMLKSTFQKFADANSPIAGQSFKPNNYQVAYMDKEASTNLPIGIKVQSSGEFSYQKLLDPQNQNGKEVYKLKDDRIYLKGYTPITVKFQGGAPLTFMFVPLGHGDFPRVVAQTDFQAQAAAKSDFPDGDDVIPPNAFTITAQVPLQSQGEDGKAVRNTACAVAKIANESGSLGDDHVPDPAAGGYVRIRNLPGVSHDDVKTTQHVLEYTNKVLSMRWQAVRYGELAISNADAQTQNAVDNATSTVLGAGGEMQALLGSVQSASKQTAGWTDSSREVFSRTMLNPVEIPWGTSFGFRLITFLKWLNCTALDDECNHSIFAGVLPKPLDQMVCCYLKYPFMSLSLNGPLHTASLTPKLAYSYTPVIHQYKDGPEKIESLIEHKSAMDKPGCISVNGYGTIRPSNAKMNSLFYDWENNKYWPTWLAMLVTSLADAAAGETRGTVSVMAFAQWTFFNWIDRDFLFAYLFHWAFSDIKEDSLKTHLSSNPGEDENGYSGMRVIKSGATGNDTSLLSVKQGGPFKDFTEDASLKALLYDRRDEGAVRPIYDDLLQRLCEISPAGYDVEGLIKGSDSKLPLGEDCYLFWSDKDKQLKLSTSKNGVVLPDWINKSTASDGSISQQEYFGHDQGEQAARTYKLVDPKKDWEPEWSQSWADNYPARVAMKDIFRFSPSSGGNNYFGEVQLAAKIEKRCFKNGQLTGAWNEPEQCFCEEQAFGPCDNLLDL